MKKILVVATHPIQYYSPIFKKIAEKGVKIKVIYFSDFSVRNGLDKEFGVKFSWDNDLLSGYDYDIVYPGSRSIPHFMKSNIPDLKRRITDFAPNVVWVFGYVQRFIWQVLSLKKQLNFKILYLSDSNFALEKQKISQYPVKFWFKRWLLKYFFSKIDICYCTSDKNREYLLYYGAKETTIHNIHFTIDVDTFIKSNSEEVNKRLDDFIQPDHIVFCWSGKFIQRKRGQDFIYALKKLLSEGVKVQGIMIGAGKCEKEWRDKFDISEPDRYLLFTGFVNVSAIGSYLKRSDAFVFTSDYEPYGLSVTEAVVCGLPVIVAEKCGCVGEHAAAIPEVNALIYNAGDCENLTNHMRKIAYDNSLRKKLASESIKMSPAHSSEYAANKIIEIINQL